MRGVRVPFASGNPAGRTLIVVFSKRLPTDLRTYRLWGLVRLGFLLPNGITDSNEPLFVMV